MANNNVLPSDNDLTNAVVAERIPPVDIYDYFISSDMFPKFREQIILARDIINAFPNVPNMSDAKRKFEMDLTNAAKPGKPPQMVDFILIGALNNLSGRIGNTEYQELAEYVKEKSNIQYNLFQHNNGRA